MSDVPSLRVFVKSCYVGNVKIYHNCDTNLLPDRCVIAYNIFTNFKLTMLPIYNNSYRQHAKYSQFTI